MTQDKKELLELAARAAGYTETKVDESGWFYVRTYNGEPAEWELWDSVDNDGDCARLEDAAQVSVNWGNDRVRCWGGGYFLVEIFADHNNDRQAARRLASTRAAAEVGRGMKS